MMEALRRILPEKWGWPSARPDPAERRQHVRHAGPALTLKIEGARYQTLDWSLGGCKIPRFGRALSTGDRLAGKVVGVRGAGSGEFLAEVVHVSEEFGIGLRWVEIATATFQALRAVRYPAFR